MSYSDAVFEPLEPRLLLAADWTLMVYVAADNDLEGAAIDDINEMEVVGSTADVNVVVQIDRTPGHDASNGDWTNTRRGLITQDGNTNTINSTLAGVGEVNMGAANNLRDFINWGVANYEADRYGLVLWDHGGGTSGVCWDDTSGDHLSVAEVGLALAGAGVEFDLIGFDACLMAMAEAAHEIQAWGDVMVASEQTEPWDGWSYDTFLADLVGTPGQSAATLAGSIVTRYAQSYGGAETLSAVDLTAVGALSTQLDTLAGAVITEDTDWGVVGSARNSAGYFTDSDFRDLGTFLEEVSANAANAAIRAAAADAETAYATAVLANHSGPGEGATGLSVYLPAQGGSVSGAYTGANFAFAADTQWDEFLRAFTGSESGGGTDTDGTIADATPLGAPSANVNANVGLDGSEDVGGIDVDFYAVSVAGGQTVGFDIDARESGGSLDSILRLFDAGGAQLAINDDAHDPDTNVSSYDSYIEYTFSKTETVTIAVSGYNNTSYDPWTAGSGYAGSTGSYRLRVRSVGDTTDLNGTIGAATRLGTAPAIFAAEIGDEPNGARDVDFYALDVESNQELTLRVDSDGSGLDGYLRLFDDDGTQLARNDDASGLDPEIQYDFTALGSGTYYVGVSGAPNSAYDPFAADSGAAGSTGTYWITVIGSSVDLDFDGTIPRATDAGALGASLRGAVGDEPAGALDVDFYAVDVAAGQRIGFDIDAVESGWDLDAHLRLFDAAGNELAASDDATDPDSGLSNTDPYIVHTFGTAGTYYAAVSGAPNHVYDPFVEVSGASGDLGDYRLRIRSVGSATDSNGTLATATPLAGPGTVSAGIGDEPANGLDVDLYAIDVSAGATVGFDVDADEDGSPLDSVLRLFDDTGAELAYSDDATDPDSGTWSFDSYISHEFTTGGTYYIGVSGYRNTIYDPHTILSGRAGSTGAYDLTVTVDVHGADLAADIAVAIREAKLPQTVVPGHRKQGVIKKVPVVITNRGDRTATGTVRITVYASEDDTLDRAPDTALGTIDMTVRLKPGKSKTFKLKKLAVPDLGAIDCHLIVDAQVGAGITDMNAANNTAASSSVVRWEEPRRDLVGAVRMTGLPQWVRNGDATNGVLRKVPVVVTNGGNLGVEGTIIINIYASSDETLDTGTDTKLGGVSVTVKLKAGASKVFKLPDLLVPVLPAGDYFLVIEVDADDAVAESNERNNTAAGARTIEWRA